MAKRILWLGLIGILLITAQLLLAADKKIVGGPFAVSVTTRSATIAWIVQTDEVTLKATGGAALSAPALQVQSTTLTSLQPNTRYEYTISSGTDQETGSFKTPPAASEPYSFLV